MFWGTYHNLKTSYFWKDTHIHIHAQLTYAQVYFVYSLKNLEFAHKSRAKEKKSTFEEGLR